MQKQPLEIQTLYAEFLEQLAAFEASRGLGHLRGCFTAKQVKGASYIYFQSTGPDGSVRQYYIGRSNPILAKVVKDFKIMSNATQEDRVALRRLTSLLATGGALIPEGSAARVLRALGEAGVFRLGGVLVGTQAFTALGNVLGVKWEHAALSTQDIDIVGERTLDVALPEDTADIPAALDNLRMGFLPVPPFNPSHPSTSFKIRGKALRLDLLTPAPHSTSSSPVMIHRFNAAAQPLPFLDYLIESPIPAGLPHGEGLLVQVPQPARYALHKLVLAGERGTAQTTKIEKDLRQAAQIIEALMLDRPGDLGIALQNLRSRGAQWIKRFNLGIKLLAQRDSEMAGSLAEMTD